MKPEQIIKELKRRDKWLWLLKDFVECSCLYEIMLHPDFSWHIQDWTFRWTTPTIAQIRCDGWWEKKDIISTMCANGYEYYGQDHVDEELPIFLDQNGNLVDTIYTYLFLEQQANSEYFRAIEKETIEYIYIDEPDNKNWFLKSCPCCGEKIKIEIEYDIEEEYPYNPNRFWVRCKTCGQKTPWQDTPIKAGKVWNELAKIDSFIKI